MSLDNVQFKVSYDGDGSEKDFDFPFRILAEGDLTVIIRDVLNQETELDLDIDYTVSGVNEAGGTVSCAVAPGATDEIHIIRIMTLKQFLELQTDGALPSIALEQTLDRIVMMLQQVSGKTDRAVMLTLTTALDEIYLPDPELNAGKYLKFNAAGTAIEAAAFESAGSVQVSALGETLIIKATAGEMRTVLGLGTAATRDTGTGAAHVALVGDLGGAAMKDTGTGAGEVPTNADLDTAAYEKAATFGIVLMGEPTAASAREDLGFGSAATADVGTGADDVPSVTLLGEFAFIDRAAAPVGFPFMAGLDLAVNEIDDEHDVDILEGVAREEGGAAVLKLTGILTKRIDAAWAQGHNGGGMFTGSVEADTWYHVHLIREDSSSDIDVGFDTSLTAANKPAGWGSYRYLGSVLTDGSANILDFASAGQVGSDYGITLVKSETATAARSVLALGTAAVKDTGAATGNVPELAEGGGTKGDLMAHDGAGWNILPVPATDQLVLQSNTAAPEGLSFSELALGETLLVSTWGRTLVDDPTATAARTTLELGTAAVLDVGTGADDLPSVTLLGTAALLDTGTAPEELPTVTLLGTAALLDTGTAPEELPTVTLLGTAALKDTGIGTGELPDVENLVNIRRGAVGWILSGTMGTGTVVMPKLIAPYDMTFSLARANALTAPVGAALIFDINIGATSIFGVSKIEMADGEKSASQATFGTATLAQGDELSIDIDQVGSATAGADVSVQLEGLKLLNA